MAMKTLGFAGIGIAVLAMACGGTMPVAPSQLNNGLAVVVETPTVTESSAPAPRLTTQYISDATVTLEPDGTASRAVVSVAVGHTILMVNNTSQYVRVRSYNCTEFATMGLQPGAARHTMPFESAGTCDYFAYAPYPQKAFQGQVTAY